MQKLKRVARYLEGRPRMIIKFKYQSMGGINIDTDSDFAGCQVSRKSTSGGMAFRGSHLIKSWANTQGVVALSSGEAELYAAVKGCCIGIGVKSMCEDLGMRVGPPTIRIDSTAAKGIMSRLGLGKMKHIETNQLWVQDAVKCRRLLLRKVFGKDNCADMGTKAISEPEIMKHLSFCSCEFSEGRPAVAPHLAS